jgi:hypothetical protein
METEELLKMDMNDLWDAIADIELSFLKDKVHEDWHIIRIDSAPSINHRHSQEISSWMCDNINGIYDFSGKSLIASCWVAFECKEDAVMFSLKWG